MIGKLSNSRKQGDPGVALAVAWFATHGYTVSIPLSDCQPYALVVDCGGVLQRVFVRTSTVREKRQYGRMGAFTFSLRTMGGNKTQFRIRQFDPTAVEVLYLICGDGTQFLIPVAAVTSRSFITMGQKYISYKVVSSG